MSSGILDIIFRSVIETLEVLETTQTLPKIDNFWRAFQSVWKSKAKGKPYLNFIRQYCQLWTARQSSEENPLDLLITFIVHLSDHLTLVQTQLDQHTKKRRIDQQDAASAEEEAEEQQQHYILQIQWPIMRDKDSMKRLVLVNFQDNYKHYAGQIELVNILRTPNDLIQALTKFQEQNRFSSDSLNDIEKEFQTILHDIQKEDWYQNQMQLYREEPKLKVPSKILRIQSLHPAVIHSVKSLTASDDCEVYSHQAKALDHLLDGHDVCVSTSTASGKSLIFMTYGINRLIAAPVETVLTLYPTKALAQDQLSKWEAYMKEVRVYDSTVPDIKIRVIDGDTSYNDRRTAALEADILLTNFDFCHKTMLTNIGTYGSFFRRLRFLIVDEAHTYRGVFGAHCSMALRRILLMHHLLNSTDELPPAVQIITCTATLGNPHEHFCLLTGRNECKSVADDGSPAESKYFVLWDPPAVAAQKFDSAVAALGPKTSQALGIPSTEINPADEDARSSVGPVKRRNAKPNLTPKLRLDLLTQQEMFKISAINEAIRIFIFMVQRGIRTFLFCNARILVEIIYFAVQKKLSKDRSVLNKIVSYRGGYTRETRRVLERKIFRNEACGVISTNALELGIDLGLLDVVLTLGFEGSVSSVRQRLGRAGRSMRPSLGILVAFDSPVERFVVKQLGNGFWSKKAEPVTFDPSNEFLLKQHLICALKEAGRPLELELLRKYLGPKVENAIAIALKTEEIGETTEGVYRFKITSRFLIVSDGEEEKHYEQVVRHKEKSMQGEGAEAVPSESAMISRMPFMNPLHQEKQVGQFVSEEAELRERLDQIAERSRVHLLTGDNKEKERPVFFLSDLSHMKNAKTFCDPHPVVDLRSSGIPNVSLYLMGPNVRTKLHPDESGGFMHVPEDEDGIAGLECIDEVNLVQAFLTTYAGAVYPLRGKNYLVRLFNYKKRYAVCTLEQKLDFYTACSDRHAYKLLALDRVLNHTTFPIISPDLEVFLGPLRVTWSVPSYWHVSTGTTSSQQKEQIDLSLPDLAYDTRGIVFDFKSQAIQTFYKKATYLLTQEEQLESFNSRSSPEESLLSAALHALGHAITRTATTVVWCDLRELESSCPSAMTTYQKTQPRLYIFEKPASLALGLVDVLFRNNGAKLRELLLMTKKVMDGCQCSRDSCATGCLDCVLLPYCVERNALVNYWAGRILLELLIPDQEGHA